VRPLADALEHGFTSVEADIFLRPEGLLIGHEARELKPERTLQSLYLDPLRARLKAGGGRVYGDTPFYLMIDVKSEAEATYAALDKVLAEYPDVVSLTKDGKLIARPVTVILSGNRAQQTIAHQALRYVAIDGRLEDLKVNPSATLVPWISANWNLVFTWRGDGPMPAAEKARLAEIVKQAHAQGRQVRFWGTPENEAVWKELLAAGVDRINTDKLAQLQAFLLAAAVDKSQAAGKRPGHVRVAGIVLKWLRTDKEANYRRAEKLIEEAAKGQAQLVCTTECFLDGYAIKDKTIPLADYRALGEPIPDGELYRRLAALADRLEIHLIAGLLEADGEHRYNAAVLIGPEGQLIGKYRKHKLEHELVRNTPGSETPVFDTPLGRIGIMICADRRDGDLVKRLAGGGAELLVCPSGGMFGPKSNDHILQDRSRENRLPILFVHPAEFLITGPEGQIAARTILGEKLEIEPREIGTAADQSDVFFFDLPSNRKP
jgi:predicted amidohydrolase